MPRDLPSPADQHSLIGPGLPKDLHVFRRQLDHLVTCEVHQRAYDQLAPQAHDQGSSVAIRAEPAGAARAVDVTFAVWRQSRW